MSLATAESLRTPSSPICKPWKRVCIGEATRATVSGCRGVILRRVESSARIWQGAPRTTCSAGSTPARMRRRIRWFATPTTLAASVMVSQAPSISVDRQAWMPRTGRPKATQCAVQVLPCPVGIPMRLSEAAIWSSDQRPAMLRITPSASPVVSQPCSPARGLRTLSSEWRPPRQWIVRTTSRTASQHPRQYRQSAFRVSVLVKSV